MPFSCPAFLRVAFLSSACVGISAAMHFPKPKSAQEVAPMTSTSSVVKLPIEVMGSNGTTSSVQVTVPSGANVSGTIQLQLQIHGLEYQNQASVKVNGSAWIPLNNSTVHLQGLAANYGGIGGGFSTISLTVALPSSTVQVGNNTVSFQFVSTDGNSSGFRILSFNFVANGTSLLPASQFTEDNPASWTPPSTAASDIAAGKSLYQTATLKQPVPGSSAKTLKAHCMDCHTQDGRDLKYFNYSNNSIYQRALFHGLNSTQANQIVSYIRSMTTPVPSQARPWNPPYQPGPGLDSQPVANWAAGAGLSAVLASDAAMLSTVSPTQTPADFKASGNFSVRNAAVSFQLMDWNHWLPRIHPLDAFGSEFANSNFYADYTHLREVLVAGDAAVYNSNSTLFGTWDDDDIAFRGSVEPHSNDPVWSNPNTAASIYSLSQWNMVKLWEINQDFGLEGMAQSVFGPQADSRAWYSATPFHTSPNIMMIPPGSPGIHNGTVTTFNYVSYAWYFTQLILNDSNKGDCGNTPIDWAYYFGFVNTMSSESGPQAMLLFESMLKAMQEQDNGATPTSGCPDWVISRMDPIYVTYSGASILGGISSTTRANLLNAYYANWLPFVATYTPQQYYQGGFTTPNAAVTPGVPFQNFADNMAYSIPRLHYLGLSSSLTTALINWASAMWPSNGYNWQSLATATCSPTSNGMLNCSSD